MFKHLPRGLREQPSQVFIGLMMAILGLSYVTGLTESLITVAIGTIGLRIWGALLSLTGLGLVVATIRAKPSLEKLCLRGMALSFLAYTGYLLTVTSAKRAGVTIALAVLLSGVAEIRAQHLTALFNKAGELRKLGSDDG